ncbi:MAG: hypothetical protein ACLTXM_02965 [Enterococcus sp.]
MKRIFADSECNGIFASKQRVAESAQSLEADDRNDHNVTADKVVTPFMEPEYKRRPKMNQ